MRPGALHLDTLPLEVPRVPRPPESATEAMGPGFLLGECGDGRHRDTLD